MATGFNLVYRNMAGIDVSLDYFNREESINKAAKEKERKEPLVREIQRVSQTSNKKSNKRAFDNKNALNFHEILKDKKEDVKNALSYDVTGSALRNEVRKFATYGKDGLRVMI